MIFNRKRLRKLAAQAEAADAQRRESAEREHASQAAARRLGQAAERNQFSDLLRAAIEAGYRRGEPGDAHGR